MSTKTIKQPKIKYTSKLSRFKDIKKRNIRFHQLDDETKRREIAYDALQLLVHDEIGVTGEWSNGRYWTNAMSNTIKYSAQSPEELQYNALNNLDRVTCAVCAKGSIMLSTIRLGNQIKPNNFGITNCDNAKLLQGFNQDVTHYMEREYEHSYYVLPYSNNTREKLMNILCNVIVNGNFNTEDKTDYLIDVPIKTSRPKRKPKNPTTK